MLTDATLTKLQKNAVFKLVSRYKFDPVDFQWKEDKHHAGYGEYFTASSLVHIPTAYYFTFGAFDVIRSPGRRTKVEREKHELRWEFIVSRLDEWLTDLKDEVDAPDLWAIALQHKKLAELSLSPDEDNNRPFSKK